MTKAIFLCFLFGISGVYSRAQERLPAFEVASIRVNNSMPAAAKAALANQGTRIFAYGKSPLSVSGDSVRIKNVTLAELIHMAYGLPANNLKDPYVKGLPSWALPGGDYYDVNAKAPQEVAANSEQFRLMLQSLLRERFRLQLHQEVREQPAYDLVISKNGLRMKQQGAPPWTHIVYPRRRDEVAEIVLALSKYLDRPLIDRTGLTGWFEYTDWSQQEADDMSIFTLAQDRLGLKIEPVKEQLKVLVIEHVEKPSGN